MKAAIYHQYGGSIMMDNLPDPSPSPDGVVIKVKATGICRSDWYGWKGNDSDIVLPHIPGHELAGEVVAVGRNVNKWKGGERVTVPFVGGCGHCPECASGNHQVCDHQFQPGFTAWGSFAEYVAIDYADVNLVELPESMDYVSAASLGCRFITAFRGVVDLGNVEPGQWVAVYGCGGVGLSSIMIAKAYGAHVIAVDINEQSLKMAEKCGADYCINSLKVQDISHKIHQLSHRGAHISIDALGHKEVIMQSVYSLRKKGRHIQIGLLEKEDVKVSVPMDRIIAHELKILGSHGMQAHRYTAIWELIEQGKVEPSQLISNEVNLKDGIDILTSMELHPPEAVAVITDFS
ncbi:MAG: zinc-dependent alcohol dehydrogenase family protein [Saprospiraceae bacterium]|nr:zinc-dependent alcohol dehydrogenase family protein [Saprospiraceae bacterium]